jgi:beta-N-acetylhexosaminidase
MPILKAISQNKNIFKPVIYGIAGTALSDAEKYFFAKSGALGFIIFTRNAKNKLQLKNLTDSLREVMQGEVLILIDQEGGRVTRLQAKDWKLYPGATYFTNLYQENPVQSAAELLKNFQDIARDLTEVGINVNCAPVLDILTAKTSQVLDDRTYGQNAAQVSLLAQEVCKGLLSQGVYPVIKHIPGHGRASSDSHLELPVVTASLDELRKSDFIPFMQLRDQKFAMTAHVLFTAIDKNNCVTTSPVAIKLIRQEIGFNNILISDDISMKALQGSYYHKTKSILKAGCDIILHCNGNMDEMQEINSALPNLNDDFWERFVFVPDKI